ncbi:hypothetical protein A4X06_0g2450 [Tilletia controversa]|uniref:2-dehydropantoate 2-reductase n=1 Tax=Tilletia controversa TaxID=13291 RepID=A0A8X7SYJ3_9BASI|nr:hypothetical protein CF328_g2005 [Tilletia controversa]KAE8252030.1 hypothetical protein A4X06_0g2450 [Tilletia controversa]
MQIHILGGGAVGQLFAFHLTRTLRAASSIPPYLHRFLPAPDRSGTTIHIRNPGLAQKLNEQGGFVTLEHGGHTRAQDGIVVQGGLGALPGAPPATLPEGTRSTGPGSTFQDQRKWKRILAASAQHQLRTHELQQRDVLRSGISLFEPDRGPEAHIDALFLCTKADTTSFALESLLPRLSARSTLVLTQNGLGLADVLIAKHFPDPRRRPWIILSSLTHGLYRTRQSALHAVHASLGDIHFGVLPDLRCHSLVDGLEKRAAWPATANSASSTSDLWPPDTLSLEHIDQHFAATSSSYSMHQDGYQPHEASTLVQTISLLLAAEELKATWDPLPDFHRRALRKLAINACINPLTALLECQNGALVGDGGKASSHSSPSNSARWSEAQRERGQECLGIMKDVCQEISAVVQERAGRTWWAARQNAHDQGSGEAAGNDEPASWSASDVLDFTASSAARANDESSSSGPTKIDLLPQSLVSPNTLDLSEQLAPPPLHPTLTSEALFTEVQRVLDLVRENYSSMYQDVVLNGRASSEVSFVNGYVRRMADALNEERVRLQNQQGNGKGKGSESTFEMKDVHAPVNRMLERLVVAKCDLFGSLALPSSSSKPTRSPSFTSMRNKPPREIQVPDRERVGYRKKRAGGYGRLWEYRRLVQFFRQKEAKRLEGEGDGEGESEDERFDDGDGGWEQRGDEGGRDQDWADGRRREGRQGGDGGRS